MELRHLRYFSAVAGEGGVGRAAAKLNLAQPALSRQIKDLEEEIGLTLLERTPKGVSTTDAGDAFMAGATKVISAAERAVEAARRAAAGREGRCVLGVGRVVLGTWRFTQILQFIAQKLPDVDLGVEEVFAADQGPLVADGTLDIGLGIVPEPIPSLEQEPWEALHLTHAALAIDHPLAHKKVLEPGDLADEPVAFFSPTRMPEHGQVMRDALATAGIRSPQEFIYASAQSAVMIVASGRGWGPAPGDLQIARLPGITTIPVRGFEAKLIYNLVYRTGERSPVVNAVLEVLRANRDNREPHVTAQRTARRPSPGLPVGFELRHLRYFVAVADESGFGRAAERLDVTQPSLSRQIADLEHDLGCELFSRTPRGVDLTDAGRALRKNVNLVFDEMDNLLGAARQARRGLRNRCAVGGVHTMAASRILGTAMRRCTELHPGLELVFEDYPSPRQPDALREGLIDVGICNAYLSLPDDPDLAHERLLDDSVEFALVSEESPLAKRHSVKPQDLADLPFLFMSRSFHAPFYDRVMATLGNIGLQPKIEASYDSLPVIWVMTAEGRGWALGFSSQVAYPPAGLVAVRLEGLHMPWGLDMLWRRREVNPVVGKVLNAIREARHTTALTPVRRRRSTPVHV